MWFIFGIVSIIATFINLYLYKKGKDYHLAMAFALSTTALTLMAVHAMISSWVAKEDWAALLDVVPTMTTVLWIATIFSILLNISPVLFELKRN